MSYSIQGKRIRMTRGDTLVAEVGIANPDGTPYCYSSNARGLLTNGRTYTYTFIKWT